MTMTDEQAEKVARVRRGVIDLFTAAESFRATKDAYERWKAHAARLTEDGRPDAAKEAARRAKEEGGALFVLSQSILAVCRAYAEDFHHGDLAAGLADLQAVCGWMAERGREAQGRSTGPRTAGEAVEVVRQRMSAARPDTPPTFDGFTDAPDIRALYDSASLHNRLWLANLASCKAARA